MNRYKAREQAFLLIYSKELNDLPIDELIQLAVESRELTEDDFMLRLFDGTFAHLDEIDGIIETKCVGWKLNRLPKVSLAAMRLCCYEMLYEKDIPVSVSVDQAVELVKKYGDPNDGSFVNGVLGTVARSIDGNN